MPNFKVRPARKFRGIEIEIEVGSITLCRTLNATEVAHFLAYVTEAFKRSPEPVSEEVIMEDNTPVSWFMDTDEE